MTEVNASTNSPSSQDVGDAAKERKRRLSTTGRGGAAYPRKRAVRACQVCRLRRTKCDNNRPTCSFCASSGATCVWDKNDVSTFDPASIAIIETLKELQTSVQRLESSLDGVPKSQPPTYQQQQLDQQHSNHQQIPSTYDVPPAAIDDDLHPQDKVDQLLPQNVDVVWSWHALRDINPPSPSVLSLQNPAVRRATANLTGRQEWTTAGLDLANVQHYFARYLQFVNIKNPILEETETEPLIAAASASGFAPSSETSLVLLICALGALAQPFPQTALSKIEVDQSMAMSFFRAAQASYIVDIGLTSLTTMRWFFLAGTFLMTILRPFDAWRMFLQCLAQSQENMLSKRRTDLSDIAERTPVSSAAVESLYWSVWKSEREVRLEIDPPDFHGPSLRSPPYFKDLNDSSGGRKLDDWYFYLSEISIWRIETVARGKMEKIIVEERTDVLGKLADLAEEVLLQVKSWRDSLAPAMALTLGDQSHSSSAEDVSVYKFVLRGRTTYIHELITWPFVYSYLHHMTSRPRDWLWLKRGLAFHLERLTINRPGYYFRHHGTWLMMRTSARSASILLAAARLPDTRAALPVGWEDAFLATTKMLRFWADDVPGMRRVVDQLHRGYVSYTHQGDRPEF